tara:strand:+ start:921 stop:1352 length:432 start_codon:yes stop_codon:yes gene_type:complete
MTRMKSFYKLTGISLVIIVFYVSLMLGSSELGGEVATLLRPEQDGSIKKIRIWIVDDDSKSWIEHGDNNSFWINQLKDQPEISLIREGQERDYIAIPDLNSHDHYHKLREEKYGIATKIVEIGSFNLSGKGGCKGIPVSLKLK